MLSFQLLISGRVQGVGFRRFVQQHFQGIKAQGWVRNLEDGRVEVYVRCTQTQLNEAIEKIRQGPPLSSVAYIEINPAQEDPNQNFVPFKIS